ncbi:MAG: hypothetical protein FJX32_02545 [Alphaproteobacteria bacterium]|nr:hypothetical protein [Alphaproteobacteria bacterium]
MTLSPLVEDWKLSVATAPNDTFFANGSLWGMYGDTSGTANPFGSQAANAWAQGHTGSMANVVGVIDTGLDYTHPDLYLNIWLNQREIPTSLRAGLSDMDADGPITFRDLNASANAAHVRDVNGNGRIDAGDLLNDARWENGVDEDGNGFLDDLIGWDFANKDNDPMTTIITGRMSAGPLVLWAAMALVLRVSIGISRCCRSNSCRLPVLVGHRMRSGRLIILLMPRSGPIPPSVFWPPITPGAEVSSPKLCLMRSQGPRSRISYLSPRRGITAAITTPRRAIRPDIQPRR